VFIWGEDVGKFFFNKKPSEFSLVRTPEQVLLRNQRVLGETFTTLLQIANAKNVELFYDDKRGKSSWTVGFSGAVPSNDEIVKTR
jgi:hypothetical protein